MHDITNMPFDLSRCDATWRCDDRKIGFKVSLPCFIENTQKADMPRIKWSSWRSIVHWLQTPVVHSSISTSLSRERIVRPRAR